MAANARDVDVDDDDIHEVYYIRIAGKPQAYPRIGRNPGRAFYNPASRKIQR